VSSAKSLIFLGFAFHEQNMRLVKPKRKVKEKKVFGTAFGMSASDVDVVHSEINEFFSREPSAAMIDIPVHIDIIRGLTCSDLFDEFAKSLPA
jgi:hypothetical protein